MTERIYHLIGQVKQSALEQKNADGRFFLAVQWHPEMMAAADPIQQRIITSFVQSCSL